MNYGGVVKQVLEENRQVLEAVNPEFQRLGNEVIVAGRSLAIRLESSPSPSLLERASQ